MRMSLKKATRPCEKRKSDAESNCYVHFAGGVVTFAVSSALSSDASGELDVLRHDRDPLCMDGAKVAVLEETDEVGLGRLLER